MHAVGCPVDQRGKPLCRTRHNLYKISTLIGNSPEICRYHYATLIPEAVIQSVEFDERVKVSAAVEK